MSDTQGRVNHTQVRPGRLRDAAGAVQVVIRELWQARSAAAPAPATDQPSAAAVSEGDGG